MRDRNLGTPGHAGAPRRVAAIALSALVLIAALLAFESDRSRKAEAFGLITVSHVSDQYGPTAGGTYSGGSNGTVLITGSGFTGANQVVFGSDESTDFTVLNDHAITAVPPAHGIAEGVAVGVYAPLSVFFGPCFFPLPCNNAYYYTADIDLNVSLPVAVIVPHTEVTLGTVTVGFKLEALDAPPTVSGHLRLSQNLGILTAFDPTLSSRSRTCRRR